MTESFLVIAFALLWIVVLPIAGLVEIGIVISDKIEALTTHSAGFAC